TPAIGASAAPVGVMAIPGYTSILGLKHDVSKGLLQASKGLVDVKLVVEVRPDPLPVKLAFEAVIRPEVAKLQRPGKGLLVLEGQEAVDREPVDAGGHVPGAGRPLDGVERQPRDKRQRGLKHLWILLSHTPRHDQEV